MTVDEFDRTRGELRCQHCGRLGLARKQVPINSWEPVCPGCKTPHPIPGVQYLKFNNARKTRKDYPAGESLDEVWARYEDRCVVCSAPKEFLIRLGIGRERQHVMEYAKFGHQGPIVPMCTPCHENATQRQKLFWFFYRQVIQRESVSDGGPELSGHGVPSDSVPAEGQAPTGELERFPDGDAKH